jgi:uncharacterized protein (TIGR03545 family)
VIDQMVLTGLRFGSTRRQPARPVASEGGAAARLLSEIKDWGQQFKAPLLSLTPIDTLKAIALDPSKLGSIGAAQALATRADSARRSLESGLQALAIDPLVDSARALATRLSATNPSKLGVAGTAEAVTSVKRTLERIDQAKRQLAGLEQGVTSSVSLLRNGMQELDDARQRDYALARSLLKLPALEAPNIGTALFGAPSASVFQEALYYGRLAQAYLPPGLQPWRKTGPKRLRMRGTTVIFPKEKAYPSFLLKQAKLSFSLGADTTTNAFAGSITGLTTQPALYGRPTTLSAQGSLGGANPLAIRLGGVLDHIRATPRDSVSLAADGVKLPSFRLPGLPFSLAPGVGSTTLSFALEGEKIVGRLGVRSSAVQWSADSDQGPQAGGVQGVVWQVVSGLKDLELQATLGGTVTAPRLSVSSNVDRAVADRLKALVGEQLARGEAKARAAVDALVQDKVEPVRRQAAQLASDLPARVGVPRQSLDGVQKQLESELKRLTGTGALPKIKLP